MELKKIAFLLAFLLSLKINGMLDGQIQDVLVKNNYWLILPDEITIYVIYYAAQDDNIVKTGKNLSNLRLIDKSFAKLGGDTKLIQKLFSPHVADKDYQDFFNKVLFKASYSANNFAITILAAIPDGQRHGIGNSEEESHRSVNFLESHINNTDSFGYTPLAHAAECGHKKLVQILLNRGASSTAKNGDNDTILSLACKGGYTKIVKKLLFFEECRDLINSKGFGENTAFLWVAKKLMYLTEKDMEDSYMAIINLLADYGSDVNVSDGSDLTAMDWATKGGQIKLIGMLLDLNARLDKRNKDRIRLCSMHVLSKADTGYNELFKRIEDLESSVVKIKVKLHLLNKPYTLSFKIDSEVYKTEVDNDPVNIEFNNKISKLDDRILAKIGDAIVEKIIVTGTEPNSIVQNSSYDLNDYRLALQLIFSQSLYEPYYHAEEANNQAIMKKIREIVKPIFKAYPDKQNSIYGNNLEKFGFDD